MVIADMLAQKEHRAAAENSFSSLRSSGLPIDYRSGARTFSELPHVVHMMVGVPCGNLGTAEARGLFLHGHAGTFKTSVAAAFMAKWIAEGRGDGKYVFMPDLMADIHASYGDLMGGESRAQIVERLVTAQTLVLDDLGKEKASEHAAGVIFQILDGRYSRWREGKWLIVTSNFTLEALCDRFPEHLGDPIQRRIAEMCVQIGMVKA